MNQQTETARQWPAAMVNITNRCNLRCRHCFVFRDENPTDINGEMDTETMVKRLGELQVRHGIQTMLWMGGEPLIRQDVLRKGTKWFPKNTVTTNGTIDLIDLPRCTYVVSIDGPQEINDAIRGKGSFRRVVKTLSRLPDDFKPTVMCQYVVTKENEAGMEETVHILQKTKAQGMTFSFYVPPRNDTSSLTWGSLERRDKAVREAMRLKELYPKFVWNRHRALELTLSQNAKTVTDKCYAKEFVMPLYLDGDRFTRPFCCMGNDVDCDLCGSWVVFNLAAKIEMNDF
jgi:MoaA/NifB/PqqE/SkfB family radical SAM enzyme